MELSHPFSGVVFPPHCISTSFSSLPWFQDRRTGADIGWGKTRRPSAVPPKLGMIQAKMDMLNRHGLTAWEAAYDETTQKCCRAQSSICCNIIYYDSLLSFWMRTEKAYSQTGNKSTNYQHILMLAISRARLTAHLHHPKWITIILILHFLILTNRQHHIWMNREVR